MRKGIIYLTLFILSAYSALAQNPTQGTARQVIDSLHAVLNQPTPLADTLKAQALNRLGTTYGNINQIDSGLLFLQQALEIAQHENHTSLILNSHYGIGNLYFISSQEPKSLISFQDMLALAQKTANKSAESLALQRIGKVFEMQDDYTQALAYYNKAYVIEQQRTDNQDRLALVLNNIGNIYSYQDSFPKALSYQLKSLQIREETNPNHPNLGYSYNDIAFIYSRMDSVDKSIEYYQKALNLIVPTNRKWEISVLSENIAASYLQKEQYDLAIQHALTGYEAAKAIGANGTIYRNSAVLSIAYEQKNDIRKAYEYLQISSQYRDSTRNEEKAKEIGRLESRLELEKKEAENTKQQNIIDLQRKTNWAIGVGLAIALVLAVFLFRGRQLVKRANDELKLSNEQINQQKEEILTQSETLKEAFEEIQQINEDLQDKHQELNDRNLLIEKKNSDIMSSINYGSRIQNALLPFDREIAQALDEYFILFKPRDIVSGDFYWFEKLEDKYIIASVDCTGHGVPGAFMSMLGVGALDDAVLRQGITAPAKILEHLDKYIQNVLQQELTDNKDGMEMSLSMIDTKAQTLTFAGARHSLYYFQENQGTLLKGDHFSIGGLARDRTKQFVEKTIDISTPTTVYVYTDGYHDQFGGEHGRKFMSKRLRRLLESIHTKPMAEQKTILENELDQWMGDHWQVDDVLVIGMVVS